mgnify:CR=1 FL=1
MAKELSEESKFQISIKTLITIVVAVATVISAYFGLMASINSKFSEFSRKPGAIKKTKVGINISITKIKNKRPIKSKLKTLFANLCAFFFPLTTSEE